VTGIQVLDTNFAGPGVFNPTGIDVVSVAKDGTAKENFFLVGGPKEKDLWVWDLALDTTRPDTDVHVLYSRPSDIVQFSPFFATGALTAFHSSLEPWVDRQQTLRDTLESKHLVTSSLKDEPTAQPMTYVDIWASAYASQRVESAASNLSFFGDSFSAVMDYDQTTSGFQAGVDAISILETGGAVMAGVFGGYIDSSIEPDQVSVTGSYTGGSAGVYMAYVQAGFTLSAVGKADFLDFDWKAVTPTGALASNTEVVTYGGRVEAAYKLGVSRSAWVEPYANVTYATSDWDRFTVLATTFDFDGNESLLGRLGFRIGADFHHSETLFSRVFAGIGVVQEFDERNVANIVSGGFDLPLTHETDATSLEVQGGVKIEDTANGLGLSINSSGRFSEDVEEYGGKAVVNYKF
jgi:outer membrane autotransporter protein